MSLAIRAPLAIRPEPPRLAPRIAFALAWASAVSILFSIAVSQILLGLGVVAVGASWGRRLVRLVGRERRPGRPPQAGGLPHFPLMLPLAALFAITVLADLCSGDPVRGLPQIRKFYVFLILMLVVSTFRTLAQIRSVVLGWTAVATFSAIRSVIQFATIRHDALAANANDYGFYLYHRITGFASHWMTFGGEEMIVLLMLIASLLFDRERRWKVLACAAVPVLFLALLLGLTRSVFLVGLPVGLTYLIWQWKKWLLLTIPVLAALTFLLAPFQVRERIASAVHPHTQMDSNTPRMIMRRTGWEMVKAHPWLGLGPEQIAPQFMHYVPADIPRLLPFGWYGHLHNIYLQYAAERGIPGLLAVLWLIGRILCDFVRALRTSGPGTRFVLHGAIAVILAILAEGFFEYNLGDSEILTMFLVVTGCGYVALARLSDTPPADALSIPHR